MTIINKNIQENKITKERFLTIIDNDLNKNWENFLAETKVDTEYIEKIEDVHYIEKLKFFINFSNRAKIRF